MNDMRLAWLHVSIAKAYIAAMQQFLLPSGILKGRVMKTARWILAALLLLATTAFAEEWSLVAHDSNEIVFVDRTSIFEVGDLKKARVLRSFSKVQTIGDTAYPHKSEILLYAVRCDDRSLAFEEWTMTAGEIGTGATVWSGQVEKPSLYKDPNDPTFVSMIASVCNG
jgi:hypothetical protein